MKKLLMPQVYLKQGSVCGRWDQAVRPADLNKLAFAYDNQGADGLLICVLSETDKDKDTDLDQIRKIGRTIDIPVYGGGCVKRPEDVKKLLYAGCRKAVLDLAVESNVQMVKEVSERFGRDKLCALGTAAQLKARLPELAEWVSELILMLKPDERMEVSGVVSELTRLQKSENPVPVMLLTDARPDQLLSMIGHEQISGVCLGGIDENVDFQLWKEKGKAAGLEMNTFEPSMSWDELHPAENGLIPVVVQDYQTEEVLMVAYMNREAYEKTISTGRMTYYSRSRKELWVKGMTSGHFQYVKELLVDCDEDTLLAKVLQVGAACHTGNRSCFYRTLMKKDYNNENPMKVFQEVYDVIQDRKLHPKEGSYTNYLFDKGLDKILKKVGEEATEIIIAAKNPAPEEMVYEVSDFLYHVMVLMAEKGVTWEEITRELARR